MDEMVNTSEAVEVDSAPVAEESGAELSDAEFDSIWSDEYDDEPLFAEEAYSDETDQSAEESYAEETELTTTEAQQAGDTDQWLELKHFDEVKKVNREEAKALAQKGMDYDRIRGKLDEANNNIARLQKYEAFLNELKGDFNSIDDLMNDTRATLIADREGISHEQALERVQSANQLREQPQQVRNAVYEEMRRASLTSFLEAFPGVKAKDIPQEVWDDMRVTNNLVASYAKYEAKKLAQENQTLRQNATNKSRSTGSMRSSGNAGYEKSEFDRVFDEDDW